MSSRRLGGEAGQAPILVILTLPVLFAFLMGVVDGARGARIAARREARGTLAQAAGNGGQAFAMARACDAIFWTGSAIGNPTLGVLTTNGGLTFGGASPKRVEALGFEQAACPSPPTPPGTACTATAWGDATDTGSTCIKQLVDLSSSVPQNWPIATTVPTPVSTWTAPTDYGINCRNIPSGLTFTPATGPPGVYCLTAANATLALSGDFTTGDGYTFFALNGSKIAIASNGTRVKFYWPSACGSRPVGSTRPSSYTCFGRTISGYDPQTMLYATSTAHDSGNCAQNAICINGQSFVLNGDIFAVDPQTFPPPSPTPSTTGAGVFMAGGSTSAGSGFIQSWWFTVQGNNGSYTGTGPGPGQGTGVPPNCEDVSVTPTLWPPNQSLRTVTVSTTQVGVSIVITGITQDEPVNDIGDGNTSPDGFLTSPPSNRAQIRVERSGPGDGRVYHLQFTGTSTGGSCTGGIALSVPHDQSGAPAIDSAPPSYNSLR